MNLGQSFLEGEASGYNELWWMVKLWEPSFDKCEQLVNYAVFIVVFITVPEIMTVLVGMTITYNQHSKYVELLYFLAQLLIINLAPGNLLPFVR